MIPPSAEGREWLDRQVPPTTAALVAQMNAAEANMRMTFDDEQRQHFASILAGGWVQLRERLKKYGIE